MSQKIVLYNCCFNNHCICYYTPGYYGHVSIHPKTCKTIYFDGHSKSLSFDRILKPDEIYHLLQNGNNKFMSFYYFFKWFIGFFMKKIDK